MSAAPWEGAKDHQSDNPNNATTLDRLSDWNRLENKDADLKEMIQCALNEIDYLLNKVSHLERKLKP